MAFDDAGLQTIWNSDVSYAAIVLKHPSVTAEPVTAFHVLRCPSKQEFANPQPRDKHIRLVYLAGLDLVPFDRITSIVNFDPYRGLEFPGGDGRRTGLRELFIKLLPEVGVGDERFRSFLPDEFHRVTEAELVNDYRPFHLRHPQWIRARRRLVRQAFSVADL